LREGQCLKAGKEYTVWKTETFSFQKAVLYSELNYVFSGGILNNILVKQPEIHCTALTPPESILNKFVATGCTYISNNFFSKQEKRKKWCYLDSARLYPRI